MLSIGEVDGFVSRPKQSHRLRHQTQTAAMVDAIAKFLHKFFFVVVILNMFQIKHESVNLESSFEVIDTRTDTLDTDVVKKELNKIADEQDINEGRDNLGLEISQVISETTTSQVKEEIQQNYYNVSFKYEAFG